MTRTVTKTGWVLKNNIYVGIDAGSDWVKVSYDPQI